MLMFIRQHKIIRCTGVQETEDIMKENNGKVKPFGMKDRLGYMFGDFGNDFTFILSTMFLLKF